MAQYCRGKSILPEQLQQWRRACEQANARTAPSQERSPGGAAEQRIRSLERELKRKTEALGDRSAAGSAKKSGRDLGHGRGRLINTPDRDQALVLIDGAVRAGARR